MNGIKPDPDVKMDPDAITPSGSGYMDDDFYEDTGELALPPKDQARDVWVTRIPAWLYEAISNFDDLAEGRDDDQIVIGDLLAMPDPNRPGSVSKTNPMRMFINNKQFNQKKLPQAFELNMTPTTKEMLGNTYVFTEKDLPGFNQAQKSENKAGPLGMQDPNGRVRKPRSKYRKAIPKQTALIGAVTREYNAVPLPTAEFLEYNRQSVRQSIQGKQSTVNIIDDKNAETAARAKDVFKGFNTSKPLQRTQLNKAARIPRNELIDMLHTCFDQYTYWPMKALKKTTKQPEAYLKEVLADMAVLIKGGSFAGNWKRSANFEAMGRDLSGRIEDAAPPGDDDGDDDLEEEMEDVI